MKAAVCYDYAKPLVIEDINCAKPGPGDVKVKMAATAICHSDIHIIKGELPFPPPLVAGHESAGYVTEVGEGVTNVKVGDHVVASLLISCGKCKPCTTGRPHLCEAQWPRMMNSPYSTKDGKSLAQAILIGSWAEETVIHESQCVKIPDDMPMDRACMLACGVITGFGAVVWRAKPGIAESCAIIGCGGVGLNAIQGAALSGAYPVIAIDTVDAKLEAAKKFGATHGVNSAKVDPIQAVKDLTGGRGADYCFVTVGAIQCMNQSIEMIGTSGMAVWVGLPKAGDQTPVTPDALIRWEKTITGCFMGSTNLKNDIPKLVALYQAGKLKLDELITHRFPLDQINEAIDEVLAGKALRNIIMFE